MFTSERNNKQVIRTLFIYIGVTLFVALFGFIYELNSNNVFAFEMAFAWRYPLVLGVGMYLVMRFIPSKNVPGLLTACAYHTGVGIVTMRSIFIGVIKIYGTTNILMTNIYTILSWLLVFPMVVIYLFIIIYWFIKRDKKQT